jgi:hypothetical protein
MASVGGPLVDFVPVLVIPAFFRCIYPEQASRVNRTCSISQLVVAEAKQVRRSKSCSASHGRGPERSDKKGG